MLQLVIDNVVMKVDHTIFSDGAKTFKIHDIPKEANTVVISVDPKTAISEVIEELNLLHSALYYSKIVIDNLFLDVPYLPYGRADRVFEVGNPNPLELFLDYLENTDFDKVFVKDPHNPKILSNYQINFSITDQHTLAYNAIKSTNHKINCVVAPDKGALEKASKLCNKLEVPLFTATKVRNISTGRIESIEFDTLPKAGSTVYIVDDILDGGGTFIPLAKKLKQLDCTVVLFVTHLIGAKGLEIFKDCIDEILYENIVNTYLTRQDVLEFNQRTTFTQH